LTDDLVLCITRSITYYCYYVRQLKHEGLTLDSVHIIYQALVQSKITYAMPTFAGQLSSTDRTWFDAFARKAKRRGLTKTLPTMQQTIDSYDKSLFKRLRVSSDC